MQDMNQMIIDDLFDSHYGTSLLEDMPNSVNVGKIQNSQNSLMTSIRTTLMDAMWTDHKPGFLPQQRTFSDNPKFIVSQLLSHWNAAVKSKCAELLATQTHNLHSMQQSNIPSTSYKFVPNEVKVVTKAHLTKTFTSIT